MPGKCRALAGVGLGSRIKATWPCVTGNLFLHPPPFLQVGRWHTDKARLVPMRGVTLPCATLTLLLNSRLHLPVLR